MFVFSICKSIMQEKICITMRAAQGCECCCFNRWYSNNKCNTNKSYVAYIFKCKIKITTARNSLTDAIIIQSLITLTSIDLPIMTIRCKSVVFNVKNISTKKHLHYQIFFKAWELAYLIVLLTQQLIINIRCTHMGVEVRSSTPLNLFSSSKKWKCFHKT